MSTSEHSQVLVIGAGPGGYAAAFLAADLGLSVTLVDKEKNPGGVCLFRGCIPSKALLHAAKILNETQEAQNFGIYFQEPDIHIDKLRGWKDNVVQQLTQGLGQLCKQRKIKFIQGTATFQDSSSVIIKQADGQDIHQSFDSAIIATGSSSRSLPFITPSPRILNSTTALNLTDVPKRLLIVGGGYIGLELGTVYRALGSQVHVVEMTSSLLPGADSDLSMILSKSIKQKFTGIHLNTKVTHIEETDSGLLISFENTQQKFQEEYDKALIAVGRQIKLDHLGLDKTKVTLSENGFVKVNAQQQTTDPRIYAIGDITGEPMLAHKASAQGRIATETIAGHKVAFEPKAIPAVVFTDPEIAWCGLTEKSAKDKNIAVKIAKFPWGASGRAITLNRKDGLTKLIVDPQTERILGIGIVGVGAGEMIAEGVVAIEMGATVTDLKLCIHPHPTLSETIMESAEVFFGQSSHIYRPKRT